MATFAALSGFLGAGKTTTMLAAARQLTAGGRRVAVVVNDQGSELVDTLLARSALDERGEAPDAASRAAEVTGGCFCCKFEDLSKVVTTLIAGGADTVIAEAVGSCTDLQATVIRPLRRYFGGALEIAPLTAIVDPGRYRLFARAWQTGANSDLAYLYAHQLAEAEVIAVNKTDTVPPGQLAALLADIESRYPGARVVQSCAAADRLDSLLDCLFPATPGSGAAARPATGVEIDYDRYASAEAEMAWLNHAVTIDSAGPAGFVPAEWAAAALNELSARCGAAGAFVGHAKIIVTTGSGAAKASLVADSGPVQLDLQGPGRTSTGRAVINLRVAWTPADLERAAAEAVRTADLLTHARSAPEAGPGAFRPAYPRPTHRILG